LHFKKKKDIEWNVTEENKRRGIRAAERMDPEGGEERKGKTTLLPWRGRLIAKKKPSLKTRAQGEAGKALSFIGHLRGAFGVEEKERKPFITTKKSSY